MSELDASENHDIPIQKSGSFIIVSLPANPDIDRVAAMCRSVIKAVHSEAPSGVVFDCSATQLLDRTIVDALDLAAGSIRLLGGRAAVSGLSPALCGALVHLEARLSNLLKANDLSHALQMLTIERDSRA